MTLESLREEVLEANLELVRRNLVLYTFGNASGIDRERNLVVIKPSGLPFERMKPQDLVVTNLEGEIVEGGLRPSSDLPTHLVLYREFPSLGGVVHTHSAYATAWAQSDKEIPCFGTTHADYFHGGVPITERLRDEAIQGDYEGNTGLAIVERLRGMDALAAPGILVAGHGPFAWGENATKAAEHAVILEEIARIATLTITVNPSSPPLGDAQRDKHFFRKHGPTATYGQKR